MKLQENISELQLPVQMTTTSAEGKHEISSSSVFMFSQHMKNNVIMFFLSPFIQGQWTYINEKSLQLRDRVWNIQSNTEETFPNMFHSQDITESAIIASYTRRYNMQLTAAFFSEEPLY